MDRGVVLGGIDGKNDFLDEKPNPWMRLERIEGSLQLLQCPDGQFAENMVVSAGQLEERAA